MKLEDCKPGVRVKIYGNSQLRLDSNFPCGTITSLSENGFVNVVTGDCVGYTVHCKQLRKLRPKKKKVTKTIEAWANVYPDDIRCFHNTEAAADERKTFKRIALVKLTGTYEVEE